MTLPLPPHSKHFLGWLPCLALVPLQETQIILLFISIFCTVSLPTPYCFNSFGSLKKVYCYLCFVVSSFCIVSRRSSMSVFITFELEEFVKFIKDLLLVLLFGLGFSLVFHFFPEFLTCLRVLLLLLLVEFISGSGSKRP